MTIGFEALDGTVYFITEDLQITLDIDAAQIPYGRDLKQLAEEFNPYLKWSVYEPVISSDGKVIDTNRIGGLDMSEHLMALRRAMSCAMDMASHDPSMRRGAPPMAFSFVEEEHSAVFID